MNKDNQQLDPQRSNSQPQQKKQPPLVVNTELEFQVFLTKLQFLAKKQIPVMINPSFNADSVFASVRARDHFIKISYNPSEMSHMICNVMPAMDNMLTLADTSEIQSIKSEDNEDINLEEIENIESMDDEKVNQILDAINDKKRREGSE